jgi:hypothetical protein
VVVSCSLDGLTRVYCNRLAYIVNNLQWVDVNCGYRKQ